MNLQYAISYATRWTRDVGLQEAIKRVTNSLEARGVRDKVYVPGATDNRYIPMPGDIIEDAAEPRTMTCAQEDGSPGPVWGTFLWEDNGDPTIRTAYAPHALGPTSQVRARQVQRSGGFTPRTEPSAVAPVTFDAS